MAIFLSLLQLNHAKKWSISIQKEAFKKRISSNTSYVLIWNNLRPLAASTKMPLTEDKSWSQNYEIMFVCGT